VVAKDHRECLHYNLVSLWGRLATCGGLVTRLPMSANARPAQDTILPHQPSDNN
jgi:hypothetical protein